MKYLALILTLGCFACTEGNPEYKPRLSFAEEPENAMLDYEGSNEPSEIESATGSADASASWTPDATESDLDATESEDVGSADSDILEDSDVPSESTPDAEGDAETEDVPEDQGGEDVPEDENECEPYVIPSIVGPYPGMNAGCNMDPDALQDLESFIGLSHSEEADLMVMPEEGDPADLFNMLPESVGQVHQCVSFVIPPSDGLAGFLRVRVSLQESACGEDPCSVEECGEQGSVWIAWAYPDTILPTQETALNLDVGLSNNFLIPLLGDSPSSVIVCKDADSDWSLGVQQVEVQYVCDN